MSGKSESEIKIEKGIERMRNANQFRFGKETRSESHGECCDVLCLGLLAFASDE